ncbi:MAG: hypothetical protein ACRENP_14640 [Longimicrobiales bacterium]
MKSPRLFLRPGACQGTISYMAGTSTVSPHDAAHPGESSGVPLWRRERWPRVVFLGPLYRSGYLNTFLVGRLEDGRDFALVAGTHSRHYPYAHPYSKWDDVLLAVGNDTYLVSGRQISSLGLSLGPNNVASVFYHGRAFSPSGAAVQLDFQFNLFARLYPVRPQGVGLRPMLLGLSWQPALVVGTGSLTIHDRRVRVPHVTGEMERGSLTNLRSRFFEFGYEYLAAARPDVPACYVEFHTFPLRDGLAGLPLRTLLRFAPARESLTLEGNRPEPGDRNMLKPAPTETVTRVLAHDVNLGPAIIHRELVRIGSMATVRYAFRERISSKS